jgi:hypothetical protein
MLGAVHNVPIWMLMAAAAASSWLVPTVIAASDVDEGRAESTAEHDVVADRESTVAGASSIEYEDSIPDYDNTDHNDINEDEKSDYGKEEKVNEYTGHTGLQIWPDGE